MDTSHVPVPGRGTAHRGTQVGFNLAGHALFLERADVVLYIAAFFCPTLAFHPYVALEQHIISE
jgi:hypothetical protein